MSHALFHCSAILSLPSDVCFSLVLVFVYQSEVINADAKFNASKLYNRESCTSEVNIVWTRGRTEFKARAHSFLQIAEQFLGRSLLFSVKVIVLRYFKKSLRCVTWDTLWSNCYGTSQSHFALLPSRAYHPAYPRLYPSPLYSPASVWIFYADNSPLQLFHVGSSWQERERVRQRTRKEISESWHVASMLRSLDCRSQRESYVSTASRARRFASHHSMK